MEHATREAWPVSEYPLRERVLRGARRSDGRQAIDRRGRLEAGPDGLAIATNDAGHRNPVVIPAGSVASPSVAVSAAVFWTDLRLPTSWERSDSYFYQIASFNSSPRALLAPTARVRQSETATLFLRGDDLQPGLAADASPGVGLEEIGVTPDTPDGPGDTATLRVRIGRASPPGPRDLLLVNPDGGAVRLPGWLTIELDPKRVDVDRSGRVDGFDLAALARSFGSIVGESRYTIDADIDTDGLVDGEDLALLAARFGARTGTIP